MALVINRTQVLTGWGNQADAPRKRTFRKFSYRGVDLDALLDMGVNELVQLFHARARRR